MSTKDTRFERECCICGDTLIGSDDGLEVFESLQEQLEAVDKGEELDRTDGNLACTLCGEPCTVAEARKIVASGEPKLLYVGNPKDD